MAAVADRALHRRRRASARSPTRCSSCCCAGRVGAGGANALALALTAVGNTAANRRLTFGVRGRTDLIRHHIRGAVVFILTLALTTGALAVLHGLDEAPARWLELTVLVAASLVATVTRYVALRTWVFTHRRRRPSTPLVTTDRSPA